MKCHKVSYHSKSQAEEALIYLRGKYQPSASRGPVNVYHCPDCGCYHLTSKGEANDVLANDENKLKIKLQKEADYWEGKCRRR